MNTIGGFLFPKKHGFFPVFFFERLGRNTELSENTHSDFLCKGDDESANHILNHCVMACNLWHSIFSLFSVLWVLPRAVKELFLGWHGRFVAKRHIKFWWLAPFCFMWSLWKEWNIRCFEVLKSLEWVMRNSFISSSYSWSNWVCRHNFNTMLDFVDSLW